MPLVCARDPDWFDCQAQLLHLLGRYLQLPTDALCVCCPVLTLTPLHNPTHPRS